MAQTAREASLARRKAMSTSGKSAVSGSDRTRAASAAATASPAAVVTTPAPVASAPSPAPMASYTPAPKISGARKASLERRIAMSKAGKRAVSGSDRTRTAPANVAAANSAPAANTERKEGCGCGCGGKNKPAETTTATTDMSLTASVSTQVQISPNLKKVSMNPTRAATLARRKAMSTKGKAALKGGTVSEASAARAANPKISSRELAQVLRTQRSQKGKTNTKDPATKATGPGRHRKVQAAAEDQPWKVGATETASGQTVTGTMVDRTEDVTGNEASTCRGVTGTEYMGADVFNDFCQTDAAPAHNRVAITSTSTGNSVSGNAVGRSAKVTGDEPGTCKAVTGTEYVSAEQAQAFCGSKAPSTPSKISMAQTMKGKQVSGNNVGRSEKVTGDEPGSGRQLTGSQYMQAGEGNGKAPAKVGGDQTLRGGSLTGTMIGRSEKVTGDEPGSCRNVTGDDYVGSGQYEGFCSATPDPKDKKVGLSQTMGGKVVSGTMTGRSGSVTGDEPGTCKSVTGTPYAGAAEMAHHCSADDMKAAQARTAPMGAASMGKPLTGLQPSVGGQMTGDDKGVCEPVTGTPYVGADQMAKACPATAAQPGSPDFPQQIAGGQAWGDFSVTSPAVAAQQTTGDGSVTGNEYEKGHITGPFGMAGGKVTGTEEARFGKTTPAAAPVPVATAEPVEGRVKSRITGEGQDAGMKITGDDWERGDHVTGTEGTSATRRNPTRRGPVSAMTVEPKRNDEVAIPVSKVTGGSGGSSDNVSLITYSGGARG